MSCQCQCRLRLWREWRRWRWLGPKAFLVHPSCSLISLSAHATVISRALYLVTQKLERPIEALEEILRAGSPIHIGMVAPNKPKIGGPNLGLFGANRDSE